MTLRKNNANVPNNGILAPADENRKTFSNGVEALNFYIFNRLRLSSLSNPRVRTDNEGNLFWADLGVWASVLLAKERTLANETNYKYKESFKLFYLNKMDVEDICKEVGIGKSSVYKYSSKVLEEFEKELIKAGLLNAKEKTSRDC